MTRARTSSLGVRHLTSKVRFGRKPEVSRQNDRLAAHRSAHIPMKGAMHALDLPPIDWTGADGSPIAEGASLDFAFLYDASPADARDPDRDGRITFNDAQMC